MIATRYLSSLSKARYLSSALVALTLASGSGSQAQSRQALEVLNQRLLPLFELAGVVFTDADEGSGRLVVGVLDRGAKASFELSLPGWACRQSPWTSSKPTPFIPS